MAGVELVGRVWADGQPMNMPLVKTLVVEQDEGRHDMYTVGVSQGLSASIERMNDAAALLEVSAAGRRRVYRGYVDVAAPRRQVGAAETYIKLMGATASLKAADTPRSWRRTTVGDIAAAIVGGHRLGLEVDGDDTVDYLSQISGESDWSVLQRLAQKVGLSLVASGPVIRLLDVGKEYGRAALGGAPVLALPSSTSGVASAVATFKITSTSNPSADYRDVQMYGSDRLGQRFEYRVSFDPSIGALAPKIPSVHPATFSSLSDSMQTARQVRRHSRRAQTATMTMTGYRPECEVGRCVLLVDRDGPHGGYWYVTSAKHTLFNVSSQSATEVVLCRAVNDVAPASSVSRKEPGCRLADGRWETDRVWEVRL